MYLKTKESEKLLILALFFLAHIDYGKYFQRTSILSVYMYAQVSYSGINVTGGVRRIFLGLKFLTPVLFWVEDLTVYFFGSEKSARVFFGFEFSAERQYVYFS